MRTNPVISKGADDLTAFLTKGSERYYEALGEGNLVDGSLAESSISTERGVVSLGLDIYSSSVLAVRAQRKGQEPVFEIVRDAKHGHLDDIVDATESAFNAAIQGSNKQEEIIRAVAGEHDLEVKITADPEHIPNGAVLAGKYPYPKDQSAQEFAQVLIENLKKLDEGHLAFFGANNLYIYDTSEAQGENRYAA